MKKLTLIVPCIMLLFACNKNTDVSISTVIIPGTPYDTFTLNYNGVTYSDSANQLKLFCTITKRSFGSLFSLRTTNNSFFPIEMELTDIPGPLNSLGIYRQAPVDSSVVGPNYFYGYINNVRSSSYSVDSTLVNITYATFDTIIGSYTIWIRNSTYAKTVTGRIRCYDAVVN